VRQTTRLGTRDRLLAPGEQGANSASKVQTLRSPMYPFIEDLLRGLA